MEQQSNREITQPIKPKRSGQYSNAATVVFTAIAAAFVVTAVFIAKGNPIAELRRPVTTTVVVHERLLTLMQAESPGLWARLRRLAVDLPDQPLVSAEMAYGDLLAHLAAGAAPTDRGAPATVAALHARRAVVLAAHARPQEAERELAATSAALPEETLLSRVISYSLLGSGARPHLGELERAISALAVEGHSAEGWTADRIRIGYFERTGDHRAAERARALATVRAAHLLWRADLLTATFCALLAGGLVLGLAAFARRVPLFRPIGEAPLPPPWSLGQGYAVIVRSIAWMLLIVVALLIALGPLGGVAGHFAFAAAAVPLLIHLYRGLLTPAGLTATAAFGLRAPKRLGALAAGTIAVIALEQFLTWTTLLVVPRLGGSSPWTDLVNEDLLSGNGLSVAATLANLVIAAPLVEEIAFRGVLFAMLRTRLAPIPAALVSAAVFAAAHGYSLAGLITIFFGAIAWALVYERTRSLLPCLIAHAANNALAAASDLMLR